MKVSILIGLPGSGKTSFFRSVWNGEAVHISKDLLKNNRNPSRRQLVLLEAALRNGFDVVIDNTNPRFADRAPLIELAKSFGATTAAFLFPPDINESLRRNRLREGKARVPDVAVYVAAQRMELPLLEEGFDAITEVYAAEGRFDCSPILQPRAKLEEPEA